MQLYRNKPSLPLIVNKPSIIDQECDQYCSIMNLKLIDQVTISTSLSHSAITSDDVSWFSAWLQNIKAKQYEDNHAVACNRGGGFVDESRRRTGTRANGGHGRRVAGFAAGICTRSTNGGYQADAAFRGAPRATSVDID